MEPALVDKIERKALPLTTNIQAMNYDILILIETLLLVGILYTATIFAKRREEVFSQVGEEAKQRVEKREELHPELLKELDRIVEEAKAGEEE